MIVQEVGHFSDLAFFM